MGASVAGASAGLACCSLGWPNVNTLAGGAEFVGFPMFAGGPNKDGVDPSSALAGAPKLNALAVLFSEGFVGAAKLNAVIDVGVASVVAGSVDLDEMAPNREALADDVSVGSVGEPSMKRLPAGEGWPVVVEGAVPKTDVGAAAAADVVLASDLVCSPIDAAVPVNVPNGDPDELAFALDVAEDEPNKGCLGASFCSNTWAAAVAVVGANVESTDDT